MYKMTIENRRMLSVGEVVFFREEHISWLSGTKCQACKQVTYRLRDCIYVFRNICVHGCKHTHTYAHNNTINEAINLKEKEIWMGEFRGEKEKRYTMEIISKY